MTLSFSQVSNAKARRARLEKICKAFPQVEVEAVGDGHLAFRIRKRIFGYYQFDQV